MNKRGSALLVVILVVVGLIIVGGAWYLYLNRSSSVASNVIGVPNQAASNYMQITLKQFFPDISGSMSDYKISLPSGYVVYAVPDDLAPGTYLWAMPDDIKVITADSSTVDFSKAQLGVFRARFSQNVGIDGSGQIADENGPVDATSFINKGINNPEITKGFFNGIAGAPVIAMNGDANGSPVYMAYLYSPVDNLVLLVNIQGGTDQNTNQNNWNEFVSSLNIK